MKNLKLLTVITFGAILVTFASCDKVTDLADVTFDATLSTTIDATSASETRDIVYPFSGSEIINPTDDDNIDKYWDNIEEWVGKDIVVKVDFIDENANLTNGHLLIMDHSTEEAVYQADAANMLLEPDAEIIHVTNADWSKLITALEAKHQLYVEVSGALDKPSIKITFKVELETEITASAL
jgi:hypothetical protein